MIRILKGLTLGAVAAAFCFGSIAPMRASAQGATATLNVNGTVTSNCEVQSQPATLSMSYDPIADTPTSGTSSFTYACTNGATVSVTPASVNVVNGHPYQWEAVANSSNLIYYLYGLSSCSVNSTNAYAFENGIAFGLPQATGTTQTVNLCGIPANLSQGQTPDLMASNAYADTVVFTFNFGP